MEEQSVAAEERHEAADAQTPSKSVESEANTAGSKGYKSGFVRQVGSGLQAAKNAALQNGSAAVKAGAGATLKMTQAAAFAQEAFGREEAGDELLLTSEGIQISAEILSKVRDDLGAEDGEILPDAFLAKCLAQHYGDVEKAANVAKGFLAFRRSVEWPFRIAAQDIEIALRTGMHWLLPLRDGSEATWRGGGGDEEGPAACIVYNAAKLDPAVCLVSEYQKMGSFLMERATDDAATQSRGVALIVDNAGVEFLPMLSVMSMQDMRRGVLMWKGAFPCRVRRIWVIDAPRGSGTFAKGLLRLLAPRIQERICFARRADSVGLTGLVEDLGKLFHLPKCLGGEEDLCWDSVVTGWLARDGEIGAARNEDTITEGADQ